MYPFISKDLLLKSLNHEENLIDITEEQTEMILICRKSNLIYDESTRKKYCSNNIDVPIGAYDSAQTVDLRGIYILVTQDRIIDRRQTRSYRDDDLIFIPDSNGPKTSKIHKKMIKAFKLLGFKIEISSKLKIVNFLDISFNFRNNTFKPFSKDNQTST